MDSPSFSNTLTDVITSWNAQGIACNPGVGEARLMAFETEVKLSLDPAFAAYLRRVNGFADAEWDQAMFCFWSMERMLEEAHNHHPAELLCFADHCINLASFGLLRSGKDAKIYLHYQHQKSIKPVADSFHEFLNMYVRDPFALLQ